MKRKEEKLEMEGDGGWEALVGEIDFFYGGDMRGSSLWQ